MSDSGLSQVHATLRSLKKNGLFLPGVIIKRQMIPGQESIKISFSGYSPLDTFAEILFNTQDELKLRIDFVSKKLNRQFEIFNNVKSLQTTFNEMYQELQFQKRPSIKPQSMKLDEEKNAATLDLFAFKMTILSGEIPKDIIQCDDFEMLVQTLSDTNNLISKLQDFQLNLNKRLKRVMDKSSL